MAYLQNEKSRLQVEMQAVGAEITNLTAQLQAQQQAIVAAQGRVSAAQTRLADTQSEIPTLEAAAAAADQHVAVVSQQIDAHLANEPEEFIEVNGGKPRPNPAWRIWKKGLDRLIQQRVQAQADAAAAHARLNEGRARVSQATAEVQAAERQVAEAIAALNPINQAIAAAHERQASAQTMLAFLDQWNKEIARDPHDRKILEQVAATLSDRSTVLEDAHAVARVQNEIAAETLSALSARRDQLTPLLNDVNAQLPAASEELRLANVALSRVTLSMRALLKGGPRA